MTEAISHAKPDAKPDAWGDFWKDNARSDGGGCLPAAYRSISDAQAQAWFSFARILPAKARVLDLATGDGRVMGWMLRARPKARLTGCDLAPTLPEPPRGTKVRAGVAMEDLPYHPDAFDAVISQFGFEYGDTQQVAAEVARVLKPGGRVALITHRADGPILAHNLARRAQLQWALEERGVVRLAKKSLVLKQAGIASVPDAIVQAVRDGVQQFGPQSAAWEISEAVRQTLVLGARDTAANLAAMLDMIAAKAANELGRIASLEAACRRTQDATAFDAAVSAGGLVETERTSLMSGTDTTPFADLRYLQHAD